MKVVSIGSLVPKKALEITFEHTRPKGGGGAEVSVSLDGTPKVGPVPVAPGFSATVARYEAEKVKAGAKLLVLVDFVEQGTGRLVLKQTGEEDLIQPVTETTQCVGGVG